MADLGLYGVFPLDLGGPDAFIEAEHHALLDALAPGWDTTEGTEIYDEAFADAVIVTMMWQASARTQNQAIPARMLEALDDWEQILDTRPARTDRDIDRRAAVAAKLRGFASNALGDIEAAAQECMGANFSLFLTVDPANDVTYWPGVNPGPPGFEWSSNRARIGIRLNKLNISERDWQEKRAKLSRVLDNMLPAWMTYTIGTGTSFVLGASIIGQTFV